MSKVADYNLALSFKFAFLVVKSLSVGSEIEENNDKGLRNGME